MNTRRSVTSDRSPDCEAVFGNEPAGPFTILRVLMAASAGEVPGEVAEIAWVDVMLDDAGTHRSPLVHESFGQPRSSVDVRRRVCRPNDLSDAIWTPYPPDVLVTHDLSAAQRVFPAAITGGLPWIGLLRVMRHLWPDMLDHDLSAMLAFHGDSRLVEHIAGSTPDRGLLRPTSMLCCLLEILVRHPGVCARFLPSRLPAWRLGPLLGPLMADTTVQAMLDLSAAPAEPRRDPPNPWDAVDGWRGLPLDDLEYFATLDGPDGASASAEIRRRRDVARPRGPAPRVVLRRVPCSRRFSGDFPKEW